jgi:hypothetical protein
MERAEDRFIELKGRFVAVLFKDNNVMAAVFRDERYGKINLNIPCQCILYHDFKRNRVYKLLADLQGHTRQQPDGKIFIRNNLIVKRVLH